MIYQYENYSIEELNSILEDDDIIEIKGKDLKELISSILKNDVRGRKPISVDASLFDKTIARWEQGELTARRAMEILNLKPNTFYRRVKERNQNNMKDIKSDLKDAKKLIHENAAELRQDLHQFNTQVKENLTTAKANLGEKKDLLKMEKEIAQEKISAKIEHLESVNELRDQVAKEAESIKNLNK